MQLVENEEIIGTLIDSNERVIAALQLYDHVRPYPLIKSVANTHGLLILSP